MKELLNTGVNLGLEYDEQNNALIGKIKGFSAAVKENLQTGSYGCLLWIREGDFTAITSAEEFLAERQKATPELIKKYVVTERGAAVAMNRTNDDFVNVNNIKRFLNDFAANLSLNFYVNCCSECGKKDGLSIYSANGVLTQACNECGAKYSLVKDFGDYSSVKTSTSAEIKSEKKDDSDFSDFVLTEHTEPAPVPAEAKVSGSDEAAFSDLMFTEIKNEPAFDENINQAAVQEKPDDGGFDSLLLSRPNEIEPQKPRSEIFEQAEREFAAEQGRLDEQRENSVSENSIDSLLLDDTTNIKEEQPKPEAAAVSDLTAEETPLEKDGTVPLINPNSYREERRVSPVNGPDAVLPLEASRYTVNERPNSDRSSPVPGYATAEGMENFDRSAPPPYNPQYSYTSYKNVSYAEKSNPVMGIIGAMVVGFVGIAVWVLIARVFDVISYWGSLLLVLTVFGGYYLGGRSMDKKGIVISFVLTLLMVCAGVVVLSVFEIQSTLVETAGFEASFTDCANLLAAGLKRDSTALNAFRSNFIFSVAVTFIAGIITAINMWKKA